MYHDTPSVFLKLSIFFFFGFKKDSELLANMCTVKAIIQMIYIINTRVVSFCVKNTDSSCILTQTLGQFGLIALNLKYQII